jgi:membrane protease YdiL (CAAX protease family)
MKNYLGSAGKALAFLAFTYLLVQIVVFTGLSSISARYWSEYDGRGLNEPWFLSSSIVILLVTILSCFLFLKFLDKRDWEYIRLKKQNCGRDILLGILLSLCAVAVIILVATITGAVSISTVSASAQKIIIYLSLALIGGMALVMHEELIFRGYLLKTLESGFNPKTGVIASSIIFAILHLARPNVSTIGIINVFLLGVLLSLVCQVTSKLWMSVGLHFGWNFFLYLANFPVSGDALPNPLFKLENLKESSIAGSGFGPEESLLTSVVALLAIIGIFWQYRRQLVDR